MIKFAQQGVVLVFLLCLTRSGTAIAGNEEAEQGPPQISAYIDYARTTAALVDGVMSDDLHKRRGSYAHAVDVFRQTCRERGRKKEIDRGLAASAYDIAGILLDVLDEWEDYQQNLERVRNDKTLLKTADAERNRKERDERIARKTQNLENLWKQYIREKELLIQPFKAKLDSLQEKLDGAIQERQVLVQTKDTPPIAAAREEKTEPPPRQEKEETAEPPAADPPAVRMGDELKTPEHLLPVVKELAQWLSMQQRRVGGQLASRMYAMNTGNRCYLYIQMTDVFSQNVGHADKLQFGTSVQHFWAMKCTQYRKVGSERHAHIIMVDAQDNVLVASDSTDATLIRVIR